MSENGEFCWQKGKGTEHWFTMDTEMD